MKVVDFPTKESIEDKAVKLADSIGELCDRAVGEGVPVYFVISLLEQVKTAVVLSTIEEME